MTPTSIGSDTFTGSFDADDFELADSGGTPFAGELVTSGIDGPPNDFETSFGSTNASLFTPDGDFSSGEPSVASAFDDRAGTSSALADVSGLEPFDDDVATSFAAADPSVMPEKYTSPTSFTSGDVAQFSIPWFSNDEKTLTQDELDGLTDEQKESIRQTIQETPTFLYHGFTGNENSDPDVPVLNRPGYDQDIENFEENVTHLLDQGTNLITTRDIVDSVVHDKELPPPPLAIVRIDDGDQTTELGVDVIEELDESGEYPDQSLKLELGINAATVGLPGTDGVYDNPQFDVSADPNYRENTDTDSPVTYRKVTWDDLGDWIEKGHVDVSNHGLTHGYHASQAEIDALRDDGRALPIKTPLDPEQVRQEIIEGEKELESNLREQTGQDYQVPTFIWPGGHLGNSNSVPTFEESGHVVGLGTDRQSSSSIRGDRFPEFYEETIQNLNPDNKRWEIYDLPAITVNVDE